MTRTTGKFQKSLPRLSTASSMPPAGVPLPHRHLVSYPDEGSSSEHRWTATRTPCRQAPARAHTRPLREFASPAETRVFPMQLQLGDRPVDASGEYEVIGRPYTTAMGKNARVRVRRVDNPDVTMIRSWGAHERVTVKRG
jgi:hypothetical protein